MNMMNRTLIVAALSLACAGAYAQTTAASTTQRDINQQTRIENGLRDGQLSTGEAARLENEQARIDRLQARALKNGDLSQTERAQLNKAQSQASRDITAAEHNGVTGNPDSSSSRRMQADAARNIHQQTRIENGLRHGSLTRRDVGELEAGQARVDHREAAAGSDGHVSRNEQRAIQSAQNHQARHIHHEKTETQGRS
jgi:hypothetical protein